MSAIEQSAHLPTTRGYAVVATTALTAALAVAVTLALPPTPGTLNLVTTLLLTCLIAMGGALAAVHGRDLMAPGYLVLAAFAFYGVVRGYYLVAVPAAANAHISVPVIQDLGRGQLLNLLAAVSFATGYLPAARALRARGTRFDGSLHERIVLHRVAALAAVGWTARAIAVRDGSYAKLALHGGAASSSVAQTLGFLCVGAMAASAVSAVRGGVRGSRSLAAGLTVAEIVFAFLTGFKSDLMIVVIVWLIVLHYNGRPLRLRTVLGLAVLVIFGLIPLIQLDREAQNRLQARGASVAGVVTAALEATPGAWWVHRTQILTGRYTLHSLMSRTMSVEGPALAERYVAGTGGRPLGRDYLLAVPAALVPSVLWPSKPALRLSEDFTAYATNSPLGRASIVPPSVTGDLDINFGFLGVALGWALLGTVLAVVHRRLSRARSGVVSALVYAGIAAAVMPTIESSLTQMEVNLIQYGTMMFVVALIARKRARGS